ncbi:hypothetical protein EJ03DRAFT_25715 [Teratosphaeria nubilosa]|uniref:Uncharacterized protein n=1 Tax=Teratosphaeria nubilosa TaxID=161662 RepID=A0A6G1KVZ1_9PEZI|nr:hypothetical protein EJ03DRAFT_25715 [Teratosphaeria nubilosa]
MPPDIDFIPLGPAIGFARSKDGRRGAAVAGMKVLRQPNTMLMAQAAIQGYQAAVQDMEGAKRLSVFKKSREKKVHTAEAKEEKKGRLTRLVDAKKEHEEADEVVMEALKEHLGGGKEEERATSEPNVRMEMKAGRNDAKSNRASTGPIDSKSNRTSWKFVHINVNPKYSSHNAKHSKPKSSSSRTRSSSISSPSSPKSKATTHNKEHHHHQQKHSSPHHPAFTAASERHHRIHELEQALFEQHQAMLRQQRPPPQMRSPVVTTPDARVMHSPHPAAPPPYPNSPFVHASPQRDYRPGVTQQAQQGGYYYHFQPRDQAYDPYQCEYVQQPPAPAPAPVPAPGRPGWASRLGGNGNGSPRVVIEEMMMRRGGDGRGPGGGRGGREGRLAGRGLFGRE